MILNDGFHFTVVPVVGEQHVDPTLYYAHRALHGYEVTTEKGKYDTTVSLSYNEVMAMLDEGIWEIKDGE